MVIILYFQSGLQKPADISKNLRFECSARRWECGAKSS